MWWSFFKKRETAALPYSLESWQVQEYWKEKKALFVDVRSQDEYADGHIPESVCLPLDQLSRRYREISRKETVILVCQAGSRSKRALQFLRRHGYRNVYYLAGGLKNWTGIIIK